MIVFSITFGAIVIALAAFARFSRDEDTQNNAFFWLVMASVVIVLVSIVLHKENYVIGQKDALKGIQTYEIKHVYRLNDTIPCDTIYTKIK